ncbi:MAG TPA: TolC family protein [Acidobacteriaceae bacterium]|jgi:outer membrane protein TolC|nr:TolC family protein [Acidobacteriaceae bacterium]
MSVSRSYPDQKQSTFFAKLRGAAAISCLLAGTAPSFAQVPTPVPQQSAPAAPGLPPEPQPNYTQPLFMRDTAHDYSKERGYWRNPLAPYSPITVPAPSFTNSLQLDQLVKNGKIYLSLSDAVLLALQNNYDIAIQRINLDIADTDILRSHNGAAGIQGIPTSLVTGTQGGSTASVSSVGGGPGGSSSSGSVAGTGPGGLSLSTNGAGPTPENFDPTLQGTVEINHVIQPEQSPIFSGGLPSITQNTNTYNFTLNKGFITGTNMQVAFNNTRTTTDNPFSFFSPSLQSTFNFSLTQHLLQGFGTSVNGRFIVQAKNDRRIADSLFRQQLLYTVNQVENIYWGLVSSYEDVQSKQRALDQSTSLEKDDEKQLQIGSMAPLDVVNAKSQMSSDQQALIAAQNTLEYQQLVMKQAISRNLDDPTLANAPVIPTDRVSLAETPEEHMSADDLVREADANRPDVEQAILNLKIDELTLKGVKNGLLPTVDLQAFYGASAVGGAVSPSCATALADFGIPPQECSLLPNTGYSSVFQNLFNSSGPNKGVEVTMNIPLRNRPAQAQEARSQLEYRKAQMTLQQLYIQIRMNVIAQQYALTNDRAAVSAAESNYNYNQQSLDAENKKLHLGASTTANVLQQERNLATSDASLIAARARYATDRAALEETLASTLDRYGISIVDAATGQIHTAPVIPGIEPAKSEPEVNQPTQKQQLQKQEQQPQPQGTQPNATPQPQPQP